MIPPYIITVKYRGGVPGRTLKKRDLNNLMKETWADAGGLWHKEMRPDHFERDAYRKYNYARRRPLYTKRKARKFHHTKPLVFTGELERLSQQHRIVATSKGVRIKLTAARKANYKPKKPRGDGQPHIDKAAELRAVSRAEQARVGRRFRDGLTERIRQHKATQTKTIS